VEKDVAGEAINRGGTAYISIEIVRVHGRMLAPAVVIHSE
jgi:hypothetical protein